MKKVIHKTGLHCIGGVFILCGLLGLVMPIIPGIILIVMGIYIISMASLW